MKTFIYVVTKRPNGRNGNPRDEIRVYRVVGNKPRAIGSETIGYRADFQAAIEIAIAAGELSRKLETRSPVRLRDAGIADFIAI